MLPKFICLVGLPAAGKSVYSKELAKEYDAKILSSDELRNELYGDVNDQDHNQEVFVELHKRVKECLQSGKSCIYDATNISYKRRKAFLQELKNIPCEKICVVMATPYEECLRRNAERERKVPEVVIKRMYMHFEIPYYYEGFDHIWIQYSDGSQNSFGKPEDWVQSVMDFNQDNPHHTMTLGEHCSEVGRLSEIYAFMDKLARSEELKYAGLLHDAGKTFCKAFVDSRGNSSATAHFYCHHNVSCYDSLFYDIPTDNVYVAVLILWHMQMHFNKEQKTIDKYRKLWGEELYAELCVLHEADLAAH